MRRGVWGWYACWFIAALFDVAGLVGMWFGSDEPLSYWAVFSTLTAAGLQTAGLLMWRLPATRIGALIYIGGLTGMVQYLANLPHGAALAVGHVLTPINGILIGHALLLYPDGRFHRRAERVFIIAAYLVVPAIRVPNLLVSQTHWLSQCELREYCIDNPFLIQASSPLAYQLDNASAFAVAAVAAGFVGLLAHRIRRGRPALRRAFRPIIAIIGILVVAFVLIQRNTWTLRHDEIVLIATYIELAAAIALPVAMAYGLLRARLDLTALITRLEQVRPDRLEQELRVALVDPTLTVVLRRADEEVVGPVGRSVDLAQPGRIRTALDANTSLMHDPVPIHDRSLLDAVVAAARLSLNKARLESELNLQVHEAVQARAAAALATAGERRRLERDLHDGAQQRLIGLGMSIEHARRHKDDAPVLAAALDEAAIELRNSLTELRELTRGVRPALLADQGLAGAIPVLARLTAVSVGCDLEIGDRLPDHVEAAAYFVISEALQNVAKHAKAGHARVTVVLRSGRLRIEVTDDGIGGADPDNGSGLRGLAERVAAVGGLLAITSIPGHGTALTAEIPATPAGRPRPS